MHIKQFAARTEENYASMLMSIRQNKTKHNPTAAFPKVMPTEITPYIF